jgi:hypothetical protein
MSGIHGWDEDPNYVGWGVLRDSPEGRRIVESEERAQRLYLVEQENKKLHDVKLQQDPIYALQLQRKKLDSLEAEKAKYLSLVAKINQEMEVLLIEFESTKVRAEQQFLKLSCR